MLLFDDVLMQYGQHAGLTISGCRETVKVIYFFWWPGIDDNHVTLSVNDVCVAPGMQGCHFEYSQANETRINRETF